MSNKFKKIISAVLSATMLLSVVPAAFADGEIVEASATESLDIVNDIEISDIDELTVVTPTSTPTASPEVITAIEATTEPVIEPEETPEVISEEPEPTDSPENTVTTDEEEAVEKDLAVEFPYFEYQPELFKDLALDTVYSGVVTYHLNSNIDITMDYDEGDLSFSLRSGASSTVLSYGSQTTDDRNTIVQAKVYGKAKTVHIDIGFTSIASGFFYDWSLLEEVVIPDTVTSIGDRAFMYCYSLDTVYMSSNTEKIGEYAFFNCQNLHGIIDIPEGVTEIKDRTFEGCTSLSDVYIPSTITSIAKNAFSDDSCDIYINTYEQPLPVASYNPWGTSGTIYWLHNLTAYGPGTQYYRGSPVEPDVTIEDYNSDNGTTYTLRKGTDYTLSYANNNAPGTGTVYVTLLGSYANYYFSSGFTFNIKGGRLSDANVSIGTQTYTGSQITPTPTVTLYGSTLTLGTDYTLSYGTNINAGTGTVTIVGRGDYSGQSKTVSFAINSRPITDATVSSISNQSYTGSALTPSFTVTYNGKTLTKNTDYTVTYSNNTAVGRASVKIYGKGNYSSSRLATFNIVSTSNGSVTYTGPNEGYNYGMYDYNPYDFLDYLVMTAPNGDKIYGEDIGVIQVYLNGTFWDDTISKEESYNSWNVGSKIDFYAESFNTDYVNTDVGFSSSYMYSHNVKLCTIEVVPLEMVDASFSWESSNLGYNEPHKAYYTGSNITANDLHIYSNSVAPIEFTDDMKVTYSNNKEVGTAQMYFEDNTGSGNFIGMYTTEFSIEPVDLQQDAFDIGSSDIGSYTYTGDEIKPTGFSVYANVADLDGDGYDEWYDLVEGRDFEVYGYYNNVNVGTATVYCTGINNFEGDFNIDFDINEADIGNVSAHAVGEPIMYKGSPLTPDIEGTFNGIDVVNGTDFTITGYSNNDINGGTGIATIQGKGNFTGTKDVEFTIAKFIRPPIGEYDILTAIVTFPETYTYTGSAIKAKPVVTYDYGLNNIPADTLVEGVDYELSYSNNTNASDDATVIITGKGNFTNEKIAYFTIEQAEQEAPTSVTAYSSGMTIIVNASGGTAAGSTLYSIDGGRNWQPSNQFSVTPGTYNKSNIRAKYNSTSNYYESDYTTAGSGSITITKYYQNPPTFVGVSYASTVSSNTTATVTASGGTAAGVTYYKMDDGAWQYSNTFTVTRGTTHTFYAYYGDTTYYYASSTVSTTSTVPYLTQSAPTNISVSVDDTTVTVNASGNGSTELEYSMDGSTWQNSNVFTGLEGNIEYTFYARYKANTIYSASSSVTANETLSFTITDDNVTVGEIESPTYNTKAQEPKPEVKFGNRVLTEGTDFEFEYENNVNAGDEAIIRVVGKGKYDGSTETNFTIKRKDGSRFTYYIIYFD